MAAAGEEAGRRQAWLEREQGRLVDALRELQLDRDMGKVSEDDFTALQEPLRERALAVMAELEVLAVPAAEEAAAEEAPEPEEETSGCT